MIESPGPYWVNHECMEIITTLMPNQSPNRAYFNSQLNYLLDKMPEYTRPIPIFVIDSNSIVYIDTIKI